MRLLPTRTALTCLLAAIALATSTLTASGSTPSSADQSGQSGRAAASGPTYNPVVIEPATSNYQYRAMPSLEYVRWKDSSGRTRARFIRSFQYTPDDGGKTKVKNRVEYHVGGSLTKTSNWRPALGPKGKLLRTYAAAQGALVRNTFRSGNGLVSMDEQALTDSRGRFLYRRTSSDGGRSWKWTKAYISLPGATVLPGAKGHAFNGITRLPDRSLVMPFYAYHRKWKGAVYLLKSTNEGRSWTRAATVFKSQRNDYNESAVIRLPNQHLLMISRYEVVVGDQHRSKLGARISSNRVSRASDIASAKWGKLFPVRVPGAQGSPAVEGAGPILKKLGGKVALFFGRPRNKVAYSSNGTSWSGVHNFYDNMPTSGCTKGLSRGNGTYFPCYSLGSSGYMGVAQTGPRSVYVIGDNCQAGWGCRANYRYRHGRDDRLWMTSLRYN